MKNRIMSLILFILLTANTTNVLASQPNIKLFDGYSILDLDAYYVDGIPYIPLYSACEPLRIQLTYYNETIYLYHETLFVKHAVGTNSILKNEKLIQYSNPSFIKEDRTYVPMAMLADMTCSTIESSTTPPEYTIQPIPYDQREPIAGVPTEVMYVIKDAHGNPVPNVDLSGQPMDDYSIMEVLFHIGGKGVTDEKGQIISPLPNTGRTGKFLLNIYQKEIGLVECDVIQFTPETKVIEVTLTDNEDYLTGKKPVHVSGPDGSRSYKCKYGADIQILDSLNNPIEHAKVTIMDLYSNQELGFSDQQGVVGYYHYLPYLQKDISYILSIELPDGTVHEKTIVMGPGIEHIPVIL